MQPYQYGPKLKGTKTDMMCAIDVVYLKFSVEQGAQVDVREAHLNTCDIIALSFIVLLKPL